LHENQNTRMNQIPCSGKTHIFNKEWITQVSNLYSKGNAVAYIIFFCTQSTIVGSMVLQSLQIMKQAKSDNNAGE